MKLNDNDLIRKETPLSITNHWSLAISCLLLTLTGYAFLFKIQFIGMLFGGFPMMRNVHNFFGIVFTLSLAFSLLIWLEESIHWDKNDIRWIRVAGGYLGRFLKGKVPPMHKLNPGQKMFYLVLLAAGFGIVVSGFLIWFWPSNRSLIIMSHLVHNFCFLVIALFIPVHVYLGTIGNPGTVRIMIHGTVPVWWARKKSPLWVQELERKETH
jgi:formate dehydrogenase subunit gamma